MGYSDQFAVYRRKIYFRTNNRRFFPTEFTQQLQHLKNPYRKILYRRKKYCISWMKKVHRHRKIDRRTIFRFCKWRITGSRHDGQIMATVWDQNAGLYLMSPDSRRAGRNQQRLADRCTRTSQTNHRRICNRRYHGQFYRNRRCPSYPAKKAGWDAEAKGLFNAPEITVITGDEVHVSVLKALNLIGFGRERIIRVPADGQGRISPEKIPVTPRDRPSFACRQVM